VLESSGHKKFIIESPQQQSDVCTQARFANIAFRCPAGIAYLAGYQVRLVLIIQDIPQLEASYGRSGMNIFMGNSKLRVAFASNSFETAELISRFVGNFGAETASNSRSRQVGLTLDPGYQSASESQVARPLLLPQEILQLSPDDEIVLVEGRPPILAKKIRYFKEAAFRSRVISAPPVPKVTPMTPAVEALCDLGPPTEDEEEERLNEEPEEEEISASH
jgi:type IV secretion system protein VirD4